MADTGSIIRKAGVDEISELRIQVTKTSDGSRDYVQIISADQLTINLVLLADKIVVSDLRPPETKPRKRVKRGVQT